jgi:hypothetical protein
MSTLISNVEFLEVAFADLPDGAAAMVTGFTGDPSTAQRGDWFARPWSHGSPLDWRVRSDANNYLAIGSYWPDENATYRRRKALFARLHLVMVDDIGTKVPLGLIHLPLSALVETSPKNFQGWYFVTPSAASDEEPVAARLIEALVEAGLTADGSDPGMKGTTRFGRLPVGVNAKRRYVEQLGEPFRVRTHSWSPERRYTVEEIAAAYRLDLTPRQRVVRDYDPSTAPKRVDSFIKLMELLGHAGMYRETTGTWHHIVCPWVHEHTGRAETGTALSEPGPENNWAGGFRCHHGHCESRTIGDVYRWSREYAQGSAA